MGVALVVGGGFVGAVGFPGVQRLVFLVDMMCWTVSLKLSEWTSNIKVVSLSDPSHDNMYN